MITCCGPSNTQQQQQQQQQENDTMYLNQHNIDPILANLRNSLLREKPDKPLKFLQDAINKLLEVREPSASRLTDMEFSLTPTELSTPLQSPIKTASLDSDLELDMEEIKNSSASSPLTGSGCSPRLPHSPNRQSFESVPHFGLDIGGSLCKLTFFEPLAAVGDNFKSIKRFIQGLSQSNECHTGDPELAFEWQGGVFHFMNFETRRLRETLDVFVDNGLFAGPATVNATGGGAYKYSDAFEKKVGVAIDKKDEIECLITGLNFTLQNVPDECYFLKDHNNPLTSEKVSCPMTDQIFPYLLVNIGSGVSIIRVDSETSFTRVGGTCVGGGTYLGLCRLLTNCSGFNNSIELCAAGDHTNVDMLVGDIYGGSYSQFGLSASTVASAFGKMLSKDDPFSGLTESDVAAGLLHMVGGNIAHIAHLYAINQKDKITRVLFAGNFLRKNHLSMGYLSFAIDYWSQGTRKAHFLKHEGYFGAIGSLLLGENEPASPTL